MSQPDNGGLSLLLRSLGGTQANDAGWPLFNGGLTGEPTKLMSERSWFATPSRRNAWGANVKMLVGDVEELDKVWDTLDTCYNQPEKYIAEALDPVIKFRKYKVFEDTAIWKFLFPS
jgi:hypothetical protein